MSYKSQVKNISGKKNKKIFIFALSTCPWCKKTKRLFDDLGYEYDYVDVDLLTSDDQNEAYDDMDRYKENSSFPLVVINDGEKVIIGFEEEEIKKSI